MLGNPGTFKASKTTAGGETREIKSVTGTSFNESGGLRIEITDSPGVGDPELPILQIINSIHSNIGHDKTFDAILMVIKESDYRASLQEIMSCKAITKFFTDFDPSRVFLIITHCDKSMPNEDFIMGKLKSLEKWGDLTIPRENVILYKNSKESAQYLIERVRGGSNMRFTSEIE